MEISRKHYWDVERLALAHNATNASCRVNNANKNETLCDHPIMHHGWNIYVCNTLQWRHNERDGVSNHQPHDCLLKRAHRRKYQSSASLAFVRGIHRWLVNSPHKWPVSQKMFPFDDAITLPWRRSHSIWMSVRTQLSPIEYTMITASKQCKFYTLFCCLLYCSLRDMSLLGPLLWNPRTFVKIVKLTRTIGIRIFHLRVP